MEFVKVAPPKLNKTCTIDGCERKHAANGLCLMHYKRVQKYGSPDYSWGGNVVGRACLHCDRPSIAREMCWRHYQMWHRHGDPLFADTKKVDGLPPGIHGKGDRLHLKVSPVADLPKAIPATSAAITKHDRPHSEATKANGTLRDGSKRNRSEWVHRKVAGAGPGDIVHHIDGNPRNNEFANLHVFKSPADHVLAHRSLERVAYDLLQSGLVQFDAENGVYRLLQSFDLSSA